MYSMSGEIVDALLPDTTRNPGRSRARNRSYWRCTLPVLACVILSLGVRAAGASIAGSGAWEHWRPAAIEQRLEVDHDAWGKLLERYLVTDDPAGVFLFDYGAVSADDRQLLTSYIHALARLPVADLTRDQQMAYWLNLYNALTVRTILDAWPVRSIREIRSGIFTPGPWKRKLIRVDGIELTLDDIEHRILRPLFQDARVHFAVNCASIGCPDLAAQPFTADRLETMLQAAAKSYVAHARGVSFVDGTLSLSSIFDWYGADFGADREALLSAISAYAEPGVAARLRAWRGRIRYEYNWAINAPDYAGAR